jgi:hypothetical protein
MLLWGWGELVQGWDIVLEVEVLADLLHDRIVNSALDLDLIWIFVVLVGSVPSVFDAVLDGFAEDSVCFRFHVFMGLVCLFSQKFDDADPIALLAIPRIDSNAFS